VVYADRQNNIIPWIWVPADPEQLQLSYKQQYMHPEYTHFREKCPNIIGVWDDHDYGNNDGGADYENKEIAKRIFLEFLDVPKNASQYTHNGIYNSHIFGPEGNRVKIILLDVRYFSTQEELLGEEQWNWLEQELSQSDAQIHLIGSGSQVLPSDKPLVDRWPTEDLERLYHMIRQYKVPGVILLSGDVHHAEILVNNCSKLDYPIYEITSSGLTHSLQGQVKILASLMLDWVPLQYRIGVYADKNYGIINIHWSKKLLEMKIYSTEGSLVLYHTEEIDKLKYNQNCEKCGLDDQNCEINYGLFNWRKLTKATGKRFLTVGIPMIIIIPLIFKFCCVKKKEEHKIKIN